MGKCDEFYDRHERRLEYCFEKLAGFISQYPKCVMSVCIAINLLLLLGFLRFSTEDDVEVLYTPSGSQAYEDRTFLQNTYSDPTVGNFESYQLTTFGRYVDILIISKNKSNIMNQRYLDEINNINRFIQDEVVHHEKDGSTYKFSDLCAMGIRGCYIQGGFVLDRNFQTQFISNNVSYPLFNSFFISPTFANARIQNNKLIYTSGVKLRYYLRQNISMSKNWENTFLNQIQNLHTNHTDIAYSNSDSLGTELNKATNNDIKFFSLTFTLMMTYACLASTSSWLKCNSIANRMNLGYAGVITPVLGIGSALGFGSLCGFKFTNIVGVMPFLIIGKYIK